MISGRIVILTLHPPTYEIFTMLSRVVLISAGRTMFSGRRKNMLPYFSSVDYPCPSFKNPSDYYRNGKIYILVHHFDAFSFSRFSHVRRFICRSNARVVAADRTARRDLQAKTGAYDRSWTSCYPPYDC